MCDDLLLGYLSFDVVILLKVFVIDSFSFKKWLLAVFLENQMILILRFLDKKVRIEKIDITNQTNYILRRIHG